MNTRVKSALIGGGVLGIASCLPYIGLVNVACCALYIAGGVLATYLYMKEQPPTAKAPYGEGAVVGLLAGVFGGIAVAIVTSVASAFGYTPGAEVFEMLRGFGVPVPDDDVEAATTAMSLVIDAVQAIILYMIFGTIGGLVGSAIFHKKDGAADEYQ